MRDNIFWKNIIDGIDDRFINEAVNTMYKSVKRERSAIEVDFAKIEPVDRSDMKPPRFEKLRAGLYMAAAVALIIGAGFLTKFIIDSSSIKTAPPSRDALSDADMPASFPVCAEVFDTLDSDTKTEYPKSGEFTLPEYPGKKFTFEDLSHLYEDRVPIMSGTPILNMFLADVTGDNKRDICMTASYGFGMTDERVYAYDIAEQTLYELSDRGNYDYILYAKDGTLRLGKYPYPFGGSYEETETAGEELILSVGMMTVVYDVNGEVIPPDELKGYDPLPSKKESGYVSFGTDDPILTLPKAQENAFRKAFRISNNLAFEGWFRSEGGYSSVNVVIDGVRYTQTGIRYSDFIDALYDSYKKEAADEMLRLYPSVICHAEGLWVRELPEYNASSGRGGGSEFNITEKTKNRVEYVRTTHILKPEYYKENEWVYYDPDKAYMFEDEMTSYVIVKENGKWIAENPFMERPPLTEDELNISRYKLVEFNEPYWICEGDYDNYDFVKKIDGEWYSFRTKGTSVYNDALNSACSMGVVVYTGYEFNYAAHPTRERETDFPRGGAFYSNKRADRRVKNETAVLVTKGSDADYLMLKNSYGANVNKAYFDTDIQVVIPCRRVTDDEMSEYMSHAPDMRPRGEYFPSGQQKEFGLSDCEAAVTAGSRIYDWNEFDKDSLIYSTGQFLSSLGNKELTAAYVKAASAMQLFSTDNISCTDDRMLDVRIGDSYETYYCTGYSYESFRNTLLSAFTSDTADKLMFAEFPYFAEWDEELYILPKTAKTRTGVLHYDYRLKRYSKDVIEFSRTEYSLLDWKTDDFTFDKSNLSKYKKSVTDFRFVKKDGVWLAERFNNITESDKETFID